MNVTIVTPVLNGAAYIEAAMDSVRLQSYPAWRHIIVDGGSTDGTLEIVLRRAAAEPRVLLSQGRDTGIYDALLKGFSQAQEGILGWLNADDLLTPWAFSSVVRIMTAEDAPKWISGMPALWDETGELRAVQALAWRPRAAILRGWCHDGFLGCLQQESMFFRSEMVHRLSQGEIAEIRAQRLAGDFAMWRAFARQSPLTAVPVLLGGFRTHGQNRSIRMAELYAEEIKALGAPTPPIWLAKRLRTVFELLSSASNVWAFRRAARSLHEAVS